jgi:hypothetical protein
MGKRIDDVMRRLDRLEDRVKRLQEMVNGKFAALGLEIAKLMDRGHPDEDGGIVQRYGFGTSLISNSFGQSLPVTKSRSFLAS